MLKPFIFLFAIFFLYLVAPENEFLTNQLAQLLQVKPHQASYKIQTGILFTFFATLFVWAIILSVRSLRKSKLW